MTVWRVTYHRFDQPDSDYFLKKLMDEGWEPFAATAALMWLRRQEDKE